ncbi:unnamed protein product, partial [Chrysoparadoxa australica]
MGVSNDQVALSIIEYLSTLDGGCVKDKEKLDSAVQELGVAFGLDIANTEQVKELSFRPRTLPDLVGAGVSATGAKTVGIAAKDLATNSSFQAFLETVTGKGYFSGCEEGTAEYDDRYTKVVIKYQEKLLKSQPQAMSDADKEAAAEEAKSEGNKFIKEQDYHAAIACYDKAVDLSPEGPSSHVFLCNRAAAKCYIKEWESAVQDCLASIDLNQGYIKAYTRLGYAYFNMNDFDAAVKAYTKVNKESLEKAKAKQATSTSRGAVGGPGAGGMPGMAGLAEMMGGAGGAGGMPGLAEMMSGMGGAGGAGGIPGLAEMMKNPALMGMAQKMMQDPNAMAN